MGFALLLLLVSQTVTGSDFATQFDAQPLTNAVELLVDRAAEHGKESAVSILFSQPTETIDDFTEGVRTLKRSAGDGYAGIRKEFRVELLDKETAKKAVTNSEVDRFLRSYYRTRSDLYQQLQSYFASFQAERVTRLTIPIRDGIRIHWFLFFRLKDNKWRLEQAAPYFETNALRGVLFIFRYFP